MVTTEKVQKLSVWHLIAGIIMAALGIFVWFNPMASLVAMACIWELSLLSWAPGILWLRLPIVRAGICWWAFWICWSALFLWRISG